MNPRCPDCGCFVSPWGPPDYCRNCDVSAVLRKIRNERRRRQMRLAFNRVGMRPPRELDD